MKKLISALVVIVLISTSCSKARKLNKTLDGTWSAITIDGASIQPGESLTIVFSKDKKDNGTYTWTHIDPVDPADNEIYKGTYTLTKDDAISFTDDNGVVDIMTVSSYTKTEMKLNYVGTVIDFKKN